MTVFRCGEALHPGPPCDGLLLGLLNPTGLLNKVDLINKLPEGTHGTIWAVSESHLTKSGCAQFRRALQCSRSQYKYFPGDFVPPKSNTQSILAVRGKERGVGFLTSVPGRSLMHDWPQEVTQHQRCHVSGFQMGRQWIQGGAFYGSAFHSTGIPTREHNNFLLSHLVERIGIQAHGPRFIGGDFNHFHDELPAVQTLLQGGWEEAQCYAQRQFGQEIQPTIQQKHTKDLLFLSPELLSRVRSVHVEADWVANHSIVYVLLSPDSPSTRVPIWKKPRPIQWTSFDQGGIEPEVSQPPVFRDFQGQASSVEQSYREIWHSFETQMVTKARKAGLNIHGSQTGRGSTLERSWVTENYVPLRPTRPGRFQPTYHGQNDTHVHWIKQLRRLQAYAQMHHSQHVPNGNWLERKLGQWRAITRASGFRPSFAQWWTSKLKHLLGLPVCFPDDPPNGEIARLLALDFQQDVQQLEKMLSTARIARAKQTRLDNPNRIFQDLRSPHAEPVQMLLAHTIATIESVDQEECALVLDSTNVFQANQAIEYNGKPLPIVHYETDKIWLAQMPIAQAGDSLVQSKPVTDLEEIYQAFQTEWLARWDRHATTADERWDPIVQFVTAAIPAPPTMPYEPIDFDRWQQAVRRKKTNAAIGPDGVSKQDLLALPRSHVEPILQLLANVEQGHALWPKQVVTGHVHALEKIPDAWKASQYRPLTVFSLVYRTWSSIRARETLAYLGQFAPDQITGNLPGKSCTDLWLSIQLYLEDSTSTGEPIVGVVADLVKAYNLLPRLPLLAIGLHLGLPRPIIRAWAHALHQMERAFSVRGTIGPPIRSSTGFAEGCGLSCSAMLICNIALSKWLYIRCPNVRLWSYVDNLELTASSQVSATQGLTLMTQFCSLLDLQLDHDKTYFWSNDAAERSQARQAEQQLQSSSRDLGAHMEYGRKNTNHVLRRRLDTMPRVWTALARSTAPCRQKVYALRTKGWPQALSAGTSASLGEVHLRTLRTGACKGLRIHAPGISPMIHLSLVEHPMTDPGCHLLVHTVFTFRRHANLDQVCVLIDQILKDWSELPRRPGPCHVLLDRLHNIGWQWLGQGWALDHEEQHLDLLHGVHVEVYHRLLEGWQYHVQRCASRRKTFQGLEWANPKFTLEKVTSLGQTKLGLLRTALNGTFFTADTQAHNAKAHTLTCKFCGGQDSQYHRFWECKAFESHRPYPWLATNVRAGGLPKCLTYHGWMGLPQSVRDFQHCLQNQPDLTGSFDMPPFQPADLFVDGSCIRPTCPYTRVAGWSLIAADPADTDVWWPIAQGGVPGWRQTSGRAEILAAISALRFALHQGNSIRIWSDNAQVVNTLTQALQAPDRCKVHPKDQDLWHVLIALARTAQSSLVQVYKIASHQNLDQATWIEKWAFLGNENADHSAHCSTMYPCQVFRKWQQAVTDLDAARVLRDQVHATILQVSEAAVTKTMPILATEDTQEACPLPLVEVTMAPLPPRPQTATHKLVGTGWDTLASWSQSLQHPNAPVIYIPWLYLLIDFVLHSGRGGIRPVRKYSTWEWLTRDGAQQFDLQERIKWFRIFLLRIHKLESVQLSTQYVRPSSRITVFWAHCISCRMCETRFRAVETFIQQFKAALNHGSDLLAVTL